MVVLFPLECGGVFGWDKFYHFLLVGLDIREMLEEDMLDLISFQREGFC